MKYGTYSCPANGVKVTSQRDIQRDKAGVPYQYTDKVRCDGYLEGAGQAALTAAENGLKAALKKPFQDLIFMQDSGAESATVLKQAGSITGVVVTSGPHFQDVAGSEYATQRHFVFEAEADYPMTGVVGSRLVEYRETVRTSGGGPLFVVAPAIEGPGQRQQVYELTPCTVVQSGYAVGFAAYPVPPAQLFPFALAEAPDIVEVSPDKMGANAYRLWRVEWSYKFVWPTPLVGVPTLWN